MYLDIIRFCLAGVLVTLPLQFSIITGAEFLNYDLLSMIKYADEIAVIILFPFAIREFINNREIPLDFFIILAIPILLICTAGLISGFVNGNPLSVTLLGVFDYVKNFLVIFIFAAYFRDLNKSKKIFLILLITAVVFGVIAILQEAWAQYSQHFNKDNTDNVAYLFLEKVMPDYSRYSTRIGIFRVHSLIGNSIVLGCFLLLILTIYIYISVKVKFAVLCPLFLGIIFSGSRMAYTGLILLLAIRFAKDYMWLKRVLVSIIVIFVFVISLTEVSLVQSINELPLYQQLTEDDKDNDSLNNENYKITFREYTKLKAIEIWKDHPMFGVGPGMFGGIVSVKMQSHFHEEYNFIPMVKDLIREWGGIDQFWAQLLTEMGIIGILFFIGMLLSLFIILMIFQHRSISDDMNRYYSGFMAFMAIIIIYSAGSGINLTSILFVYSAMVGMTLGCETNNDYQSIPSI